MRAQDIKDAIQKIENAIQREIHEKAFNDTIIASFDENAVGFLLDCYV